MRIRAASRHQHYGALAADRSAKMRVIARDLESSS